MIGDCRAAITRFFFDKESSSCVSFNYGGSYRSGSGQPFLFFILTFKILFLVKVVQGKGGCMLINIASVGSYFFLKFQTLQFGRFLWKYLRAQKPYCLNFLKGYFATDLKIKFSLIKAAMEMATILWAQQNARKHVLLIYLPLPDQH